jgi:shikimate dehydrogenase
MDNAGQVFALLGHPVSHSLSPTIHAAAYAALGLGHTYTALDIPTAADLVKVFGALRSGALAGANVTLPHKRAVFDLCDAVDPSAADLGAANVICREDDGRLIAHNTDESALAADIEARWTSAPRLRAVVIGGGGAGLAAVAACRRLGFKVIAVTSRSWTSTDVILSSPQAERMRAMGGMALPWPARDTAPDTRASEVLRLQWPALAEGASLIIQATSAGMLGADPGDPVADVVPWPVVSDAALAYDVVYTPRSTPFLRAAMHRGVRAEGGLGMLVRQAAQAIVLWTGFEPPLDVMRKAAEDALDRGGHTV